MWPSVTVFTLCKIIAHYAFADTKRSGKIMPRTIKACGIKQMEAFVQAIVHAVFRILHRKRGVKGHTAERHLRYFNVSDCCVLHLVHLSLQDRLLCFSPDVRQVSCLLYRWRRTKSTQGREGNPSKIAIRLKRCLFKIKKKRIPLKKSGRFGNRSETAEYIV